LSVTVEPLTTQLWAAPGIAFSSGAGPNLMSGSMRFERTLADVVSVARPGSSDGGSLPMMTRRF